MSATNPMRQYDPAIMKPFTKSGGTADTGSKTFEELAAKLSARRGVRSGAGLAASIIRKRGGK